MSEHAPLTRNAQRTRTVAIWNINVRRGYAEIGLDADGKTEFQSVEP